MERDKGFSEHWSRSPPFIPFGERDLRFKFYSLINRLIFSKNKNQQKQRSIERPMYLLLIVSVLINSMSLISSEIDPETALCQNLVIDAAVTADDDISYAIKGDYYWNMTAEGIPPDVIARPLSDRWRGLSGPIDAAFKIDEAFHRVSTVFLKGRQWLLYKKNELQANGSTTQWPYMYDSPTMAAFEFPRLTSNSKTPQIPLRKDYPVFLIHDNEWFSKYLFYDIQKPTLKLMNKAYRLGRWLLFADESHSQLIGDTIKDFMNPFSAVLTTNTEFIVFAPKIMCRMNFSSLLCNNTVTPEQVVNYFGCPRKPLPTTTTTTTTTTTASTTTTTTVSTDTTTTAGTTTTSSSTTSESTSVTSSTPQSTTESIPAVDLNTKASVAEDQTSSRPQTTIDKSKQITRKSKAPRRVGAGVEDDGPRDSDYKTKSKDDFPWGVVAAILVVLAVICLLSLFVFTVVSQNRKRNKAIDEANDNDIGQTNDQNPGSGRSSRSSTGSTT